MSKNAKIITLAVLLILVMVLSVVMVVFYATTHGNQSKSGNFKITSSGRECKIISYEGTDKNVTIPSKLGGKRVVGIAGNAFSGKTIENIEFEDGFEKLSLDSEVFTGLNKLVYVKLPEGLKEIPNKAFYSCSSLSHIYLPSSLQSIGDYAFYKCSSLKYTGSDEKAGFVLSSDLISIGKNAFEECNSLTSVTIGDRLETIDNFAFYKATNLKELKLGENNNIKTLGESAFENARINSMESEPLKMPKLENIGKRAFANNATYFSYFELGKTVKKIGNEAFLGCNSLIKVLYDKDIALESFGEGVFTNNTSLEVLRPIGETTNLVNRLPDCLTTIPKLTFNGCYKLLYKHDFVIGDKVDTIGDGAFAIFNNTYTARTSYTSYKLKTGDNANFKMQPLEKFMKKNETNPARLSHELLMTADGKELIAYIGTYTTYNMDANGEYNDCYRENDKTKTAFKFLDNEEIRNSLETIRGYAFAGVRFNQFLVIPGVKNMGENVFANSDVDSVLFDSEDCTFSDETFKNMQKTTGVYVVSGKAGGAILTKLNELQEKGIIAETGITENYR